MAMAEGTSRTGERAHALTRFMARTGNLLVFGFVALSLLAAVLLIFQTVEAERSERAQARRTSEVLAELVNINRAMLNAETGQRGYLITLDERYLGPYRLAREQYRPALARLRQLVGEEASPRQSELLDQIENLAVSKFAETSESVALIRSGELLEARTRILTDEGEEVMERLRASVRELESIEQHQLDEATADTARAEGRVVPLLAALSALLLIALVLGYRLVGRAARADAEAEQAAVIAEARDRADLLARELNHRVKNLFAVILAIVRMSGKDKPEAKPVVDRITERIQALLAAHEVTQGSRDAGGAPLRALIETAVRPYLSSERKAALDGPDLLLPVKHVTPLGLVLHELTTNAVKYGCWSSGGLLTVEWRSADDELELNWREDHPGTGEVPERRGFGSQLMTSAARQLRGTIERRFEPGGVCVAMRFPLAG
jgi:two-component sensor histidine kinase